MKSATLGHPFKDTATTARHLISQVPVDTDHLNRCVISGDPGDSARAYLHAAYNAAHGEEIATLDSSLAAAQNKLAILHRDLDKVTERYEAAPTELPPDKDDPRPLMPLSARLFTTGEMIAVGAIWMISVALVTSQMMENSIHLATNPAFALLVAASVSIGPSFGIKWLLHVWSNRGTATAKRLLATIGGCAGICYIGIVSHMVRPELAKGDTDAMVAEFFAAPASPAAASAADPTADLLAETSGAKSAAPGSKFKDWFLFSALLGEMCVAAGLMQSTAHRIQQYRPSTIKPHPEKVQAGTEREKLLAQIDSASDEAADLNGRRALHAHSCELLIQEHTARVLAARDLLDARRSLASL